MMMMMANPYERYREQGVLTANPIELVVMLYDGCIKKLKLARLAMEEKDYEKANNHLQAAQQIVMELVNSLDFHYPISKDLMNIYDFILRQIVEINIRKNTAGINDIVGLLSSLREAWVQVQKTNRNTLELAEE